MLKKALFLSCLLVSCAQEERSTWYVTNGSETEEKSYCIDIDLTIVNGSPSESLRQIYKEGELKLDSKAYPDGSYYYLATFSDGGIKHGAAFSSSLARCNANLKESLDFIHSVK